MGHDLSATPLWERSTLLAAAGKTLRPGGLVLTDRAILLSRLPAKSKILDVGCGLGASVQNLCTAHSMQAWGIDSSIYQLLKAPPGLMLTQADAVRLPYASNFFDCVLCECVLSLVEDIEKVITEFKRVLSPSGKIIITDIYQRTENSKSGFHGSCANTPLKIDELKRKLTQQDLHTLVMEDHSKLLTELAARLIFAGEQSFFTQENCCVKPGYMMLIAQTE